MPCMPRRWMSPSSSSAWEALKSCSSCVMHSTLHDTGTEGLPGIYNASPSALDLHLSLSEVPKVPFSVRGCSVRAYLPKPASCRFSQSLPLLTYLFSFLPDRPSVTLLQLPQLPLKVTLLAMHPWGPSVVLPLCTEALCIVAPAFEY
jgi:hypothetical protein